MEKNKKKKIIISVIIIVAVIIGFLLNQPVRALMAMFTMETLESRQVMTDVYAVKNSFVNIYLVKGGDKYIAFDAGTDAKSMKAALGGLGIEESDITAVFLTHTDADHVAAIPSFSAAEIYMSASNQAFISEKEGRSRSKAFVDMERDYTTIGDYETINIAGIAVQCIFTPGHTDGSACYIVNGKYLISGDNLRLKDGKAGLFYDVFNMDNEMQKQSLRKLSVLEGIEAIFTMHTGSSADFHAAFVGWRD